MTIIKKFIPVIALLPLIFLQAAWASRYFCQLTKPQVQVLSSLTKRSIVDYYQAMMFCPEFDGYYPLRKVQNEWIFGNPAWDEPLFSSIVDIKNGFIEVKKEVLEGQKIIQVALFKASNGNDIIGYAKAEKVDAMFGYKNTELSFYQLNDTGDKLLNVTQNVFPEITFMDFGSSSDEFRKIKTIKNDDFHDAAENSPLFYYELPHVGTRIKVNLIPKSLSHFYHYYAPESLAQSSDLEILNRYESQIKTDTIELTWDKQKSRFAVQY